MFFHSKPAKSLLNRIAILIILLTKPVLVAGISSLLCLYIQQLSSVYGSGDLISDMLIVLS